MDRATTRLRRLLEKDGMLYMPAVYDPLGGRLAEATGFEAAYVGGYVTGGSLAVSEPLVTQTEQVAVAERVATAVKLPIVCDAGAGFGEPLHTMRTVREFIRAGVAGIHIEDQLYPKRAHYHKYVAHAVPAEEFLAKIRFACRQRDESDPDFVVIARSDTARFEGIEEAISRLNRAKDEGADLGLLFPRNHEDAVRAPKDCDLPLVYVLSRGNRDGRPLYTLQELEDMGYKGCIDAQLIMLASLGAAREAFRAMKADGRYDGLSHEQCIDLRQSVEDLIGLDAFYEIEEQTVEETKWGKR